MVSVVPATLFVAVCVSVAQCRFLAPPAEADNPDMATLKAQIAAAESAVESARKEAKSKGVTVDPAPPTFVRHCHAATKAKLDAPEPMPNTAQKISNKTTSSGALEDWKDRVAASSQKSLIKDEEFLLGLLMMHQRKGDWSHEQELDAVCSLSDESKLIQKLYRHHNTNEPLSLQLARMMDVERKEMAPTKAPPLDLEELR